MPCAPHWGTRHSRVGNWVGRALRDSKELGQLGVATLRVDIQIQDLRARSLPGHQDHLAGTEPKGLGHC